MIAYVRLEKERALAALKEGITPVKDKRADVRLPGIKGPFTVALFHPADEEEADGTACLRVELDPETAYVIDAGRIADNVAATLVPAAGYKIGTYAKPRIIVTAGIDADNISAYDGCLGAPLLYEGSEKLYEDNLFASADENDPEFRKIAIGAYFEKLEREGKATHADGKQAGLPGIAADTGDTGGRVREYYGTDGRFIGIAAEIIQKDDRFGQQGQQQRKQSFREKIRKPKRFGRQ